MAKDSSRQFDVVVVGCGPAGMAAAVSAAESKARVAVLDDNPSPGGQIWRGEASRAGSPAAMWASRLRASGVETFCATRVFDCSKFGVLLAEGPIGLCELRYEKLILATGARERFLPFPGWTLPNVMGAGGLQALVKSGLPISGKRVVVAGTGPLLFAVAAYLRKRNAVVPIICEQASASSLAHFGQSVMFHPKKVVQTFGLLGSILGTSFAANSWPVSAEGAEALEAVVIRRPKGLQRVACDYLACGFHLVPNTELAELMGCTIEDGFVKVDLHQETSIPGVYCAGEPTSIGGLDLSLVEGQIAGYSATNRKEAAHRLFRRRKRLQSFARSLNRAFQLRSELRALPGPETIVCRCEDVPYSRISQYRSWRAAKLQTRCGMGACQGRICGSATEFLLGWAPDSVRPPAFPTRVEVLAAMKSGPEA